MRYFLAIILPPLAVLLCGKPIQAVFALLLWFCLWIPGSIYACIVVSSYKADQRAKKMVKAVEKSAKEASQATIEAAKITARAMNQPPVIVHQQINQQIILRIAKDGADIGDFEITQVRQLVQTGQLQPTDYYYDYEKNDWVQLNDRGDIQP